MKKFACLLILASGLAACGVSGVSGVGGVQSKKVEARRALSGRFVLDLDRMATAMPPEQRKFFLRDNQAATAQYTITEDGNWKIVVPLKTGQVVREGTWYYKAGHYMFTPTKMDGNIVPGNPFEVKTDGDGLIWIEYETSYLKKA
jgi:hypothetical protein